MNLFNSNKTTIVKDDHSSTSKRANLTLNKLLSTQKHSQKSKRGESQESIRGKDIKQIDLPVFSYVEVEKPKSILGSRSQESFRQLQNAYN